MNHETKDFYLRQRPFERFGDSRVIVGAHWQSDIDASLTAGSIGFCALQGCEEFVAQMKKAQQEYKEKTSQTAVNSVKTAEQTAT